MAYSRSILGGSDEDYSRSVLGGSDEDYSRSVLGGSDEINEIHCEPCKKEGNTVNAVKYCVECAEYLCGQCFKSHTRFKAFQNHVTNDVRNVNSVITNTSTKTVCKSEQQTSNQIYAKSYTAPKRKAELVSTIDVSSRVDKQKPYIKDLTIVHAYFCVVTDNRNMSVKVVDIGRKCVISEVQISEAECLCHITSVNDGEVAVSIRVLGVWRLLFLPVSTSGVISNTGRSFDIEYGYNGFIYHNDHFYATYADSIDKFNMRGRILNQIRNNPFGLLHGIALSNDHKNIYVCSCTNDTVFRLDLKGNIKAAYKDEDLKGPNGVTVDNKGYVYVSNRTDNVHQLTANLNKVQVIISDRCGRCAFNRTENRLYVTSCDQIKMYDLKYE